QEDGVEPVVGDDAGTGRGERGGGGAVGDVRPAFGGEPRDDRAVGGEPDGGGLAEEGAVEGDGRDRLGGRVQDVLPVRGVRALRGDHPYLDPRVGLAGHGDEQAALPRAV